jgi:hypothetical protein
MGVQDLVEVAADEWADPNTQGGKGGLQRSGQGPADENVHAEAGDPGGPLHRVFPCQGHTPTGPLDAPVQLDHPEVSGHIEDRGDSVPAKGKGHSHDPGDCNKPARE